MSEEVLAAPAKIADRWKRKVVIVFDEVQQVLEYKSDLVERRLRSIIQKHKDVSYIFILIFYVLGPFGAIKLVRKLRENPFLATAEDCCM